MQYVCTVRLLQIYTNLLYKKIFHFYLVLIIICVILRHKSLVDKIERQAEKIYLILTLISDDDNKHGV